MNFNSNHQRRIRQFAALALIALCFTQLPARGGQSGSEKIELESFGWGMVPGQRTRITAFNQDQQDDSRVGTDPLIWRVSALDAEGNQVFQSPEIVTPAGGFRYIDVETGDLPVASESPTGRKQVLWKVVLFVRGGGFDPFPVSAELIDSSGQTMVGHTIGLRHEHVRPE